MSALVTAGAGALRFVLSLVTKAFRNKQADSLIRFSKATRVEPIAMIDQRAAHLPYMGDIMQSLTSIFSGYYLQAIAVACNVGKVQTLRLLDALNPSRDVGAAAANSLAEAINSSTVKHKHNVDLLSMESYRFGLPMPGAEISLEARKSSALQKATDAMIFAPKGHKAQAGADIINPAMDEATAKNLDHSVMDDKSGKFKASVNVSKGIKAASESVNLSVGKLLEVTINSDGSEATFPIAVRLIATIVAAPILVHILGDGVRDSTFRERWHLYKAGQLQFWKDIVLCQDMIDAHKKALLKDTSGAYDEILARRAGNSAVSAITGSPSVGTASNIMVITSQTAKELELEIGGKLKDPRTREKVFNQTYIMLMVVVDPEWEQVTVYHRGIALPSEIAVKELKNINKGSGPDIGDILKAYQLGMTPPA